MRLRLLSYLAFLAIVLGKVNFFTFMLETFPMALVPSDTYERAGHYFIWSKVHGGYIEVSRSFWDWYGCRASASSSRLHLQLRAWGTCRSRSPFRR
jgi:hypothetical protein